MLSSWEKGVKAVIAGLENPVADGDLGVKFPAWVARDPSEDVQGEGENPLGPGNSSGGRAGREVVCENFTAWHEIAPVGQVVGTIGNVLGVISWFDIVVIHRSSGHKLECLLSKIIELLVEVCAHVIGELHVDLKKLVDLELAHYLEIEWKVN